MTVLSLDIGGTKLAAALVLPDGEVRRSARRPTGTDPWAGVTALLDEVLGSESVRAIGVGCGGPMQWPAGEVSPLNIPAWRDFPLVSLLAERYGVPVRIHNDAVCMALGEHWRGAGVGVDHLLGMVVSTGVGGGIVLGGRAVDGASGNTAESACSSPGAVTRWDSSARRRRWSAIRSATRPPWYPHPRRASASTCPPT